jgi:hypothetical protein
MFYFYGGGKEKMKRYQAVAFLLSTAMTVGSVAPVFGASSDILGHWAEFTISKWQNEGRVGGYEDGTFKPDKSISRAEFVRFLNSAVATPDGGSVSFSDVSMNDWFYNDVAKAVANGIASGFEDNTFRPGETVTRMQAAVFICNALKLTPNEAGAAALTDAASIPAWAKGAVGAVVSKGFMSGYPDGSFGGSKGMTRAEAVSTLDRVLGNGISSNANAPKGEVDTSNRDKEENNNNKEEEKNTGNMVWTSGGGGGHKTSSGGSTNKTVSVKSVELDKTTLELKEGESQQLVATITPSNATNKDVTWTSSDETIATVDENGNVTAVKAGEATITVTTANRNRKATCAVTVTAQEKPEPKPEPTPTPTPTPTPAPEVKLTPGSNISGLTMTKTETTDATTKIKEVVIELAGKNLTPGVTDEITEAGATFVFPNGIEGADWFNTYAPDSFKDKFTLVTLQIPLEADENGSFKLKQTNPALKDVFLQSGNVNSNNASNWDPSIIQEGTGDTATGTKTTTRDISYFKGEKVYNYIFMVEKGKDVEINIDWYAGKKGTQSAAKPTSTTKYTIKSGNVTFETVSDEQKAADAAKAVVLTQGGNKQGLEIASKTAKAGADTAIVNMTLGGTVQMGALTEEDGNRADEINKLFGNADWLANNASDYAKTQGYFVMTLDVPVPDGYTGNYASVQTNKALYDFYMSKEGWTTPSGETWEKKSTNDGKEIGIKKSADSSSGGFENLVGGNGNRKVLPFAFIAIKGEPVTLEFTFKNSSSAEKKVKYIIDTTGVTVEGTEVGGDVDEQPKVIGAESAEGLPTPKVEQVEGKSETTITYEATDKEVTGGTEKADTTSFAAMFGTNVQEAIGASYEGQQLVLTTIDVPVSHLGDISTYSLRTNTTVTMKQTNAALADIAQYLSEETIKDNVWTKELTAEGNTLKVPVLVKPGNDVTLEFSTGEGEIAKSSTYTIKMPSVSVVAPRGDAAVPKGEIIKGLNVGLEKGKAGDEYTLKVSSENAIKAGKLSAKDHGVTAEVAEDYNNVFVGDGLFKDFFDRDYSKDEVYNDTTIKYSSNLNDLVRSATMLQFTIPVPAGATQATIKQISPLMEAYQKDPRHEKAPDGTWFKQTTKTKPSGSINLAILASPQWKTGDSKIEVTFTVDGKEQKVTYTVDTAGLKTEKYTPVQTSTQPVTPETSKTQTPATPNTPSSEQPSAPSNTVVPPVEEEPKEPEENVTPPEDGENKEENTTPPEDGENKEENTTPPEGGENKEENITPSEGGENKEDNKETDTEKDTDNEQEKTQVMPGNTETPGAE